MTRLPILVLAGALSGIGQQPVFRTATDLVRIDALVEHDGKPLGGLTSDDFQVFDNGVRQRVVSVRHNAQVSLAVALDASDSMRGPRIAKAKDATMALLGQLHVGEPLVIVGFSEQVTRLVSSAASDARTMLDQLEPRGSTALFDGGYAAVVAADTGTGSKLLVLLTDGRNNASWLSARNVIDTARRHEVVIYPVGVGLEDREAAKRALRLALGRLSDSWGPDATATSDTVKLLRLVASRTGGRLVMADWTDDLDVVFRAILEEFRQRYIIGFTPEGVAKDEGWHTLQVKLAPGRKGEVHARAGYWSK
jgi:Ca-activated chloride channel family protein